MEYGLGYVSSSPVSCGIWREEARSWKKERPTPTHNNNHAPAMYAARADVLYLRARPPPAGLQPGPRSRAAQAGPQEQPQTRPRVAGVAAAILSGALLLGTPGLAVAGKLADMCETSACREILVQVQINNVNVSIFTDFSQYFVFFKYYMKMVSRRTQSTRRRRMGYLSQTLGQRQRKSGGCVPLDAS